MSEKRESGKEGNDRAWSHSKNKSVMSEKREWLQCINSYTVKPVLRGQLWDKEKESYKTGDLLKEVQFRRTFLRQDKKRVTF